MFQPVENNVSFPNLEQGILEFWRENRIYARSMEQRKGAPPFIFFEGPPTANGKPHPGHCLTRAVKDLFPRYRTMRGFSCERKAGWDTHGLPVEVEVCKELGIHSKEEIESYGVEPFIQLCQKSVWRYMLEWELLTERLGFWLKLDEAYVTYHQSYVESVWWSLKTLFDRGLLYQGYKIVWWWAQGGTALSAGEVGQGYREVADPSVFVRFPILEDSKSIALGIPAGTSLVVWTTTPWTLPSNQFAAVNPTLEYGVFEDPELPEGQNKLVVAVNNCPFWESLDKRKHKINLLKTSKTLKGSDLVGLRYEPPFDYYWSKLGDQTGELKSGGHQHIAWRITSADFVTTDSGSGAVHEAPAFGEVDFELLQTEQARFVDGQGPQLICAVGPNGKFTDEAPDFEGQWVKDADKAITRRLKEDGKLYFLDQYLHEYPFCWRAEEDPLIQYPRKSWFIRTTEVRDRMLENNKQINWLPEHIRDGRFGNFLESNVDWALSRERYWGTPLPIWVCEKTGQMEAIACYDELLAKPGIAGTEVWEAAKAKNPELVDDLRVHKPYIDHVSYDSPFSSGNRMQRVTEVIDCWYDSGAMPFAQWGYPHQNREKFATQFPADFISEALDQTRGWFYSLLAISTLLFVDDKAKQKTIITSENISQIHQSPDTEHNIEFAFPHPFKNCIVLGLMLSEWYESKKDSKQLRLTRAEADRDFGEGNYAHFVGKMSKQKRNYREPSEIFDRYGADALRWYFFANQPPWTSIRYSEQSIKDSIPEFLLRLWNVYSFFVTYAITDDFNPADQISGNARQLNTAELGTATSWRDGSERGELDRWLLSEMNRTVQDVTDRMDRYDSYGACHQINAFVDALSNWFVRRSRDRFWSSDKQDRDKLDAYWTLYECLLTTTKMIAPFIPFVSEGIWQNLAGLFGERAESSVHLCDFPTVDVSAIDNPLSDRMNLLREIASLGRSARMESKLKVRQPLSGVTVVLNDSQHQEWLVANDSILRDELNVKQVTWTADADEYVTYQVQPNFKLLGPRVGPLMPAVKKHLGTVDGAALLNELNSSGKIVFSIEGKTIELDSASIQVRLQAKEGWAAAQGPNCVVVLSTGLTPELVREGMARDIVRLVQDRRKELNLNFTDRIRLSLVTDTAEMNLAINEHGELIQSETLATELTFDEIAGTEAAARDLSGTALTIYVELA